MMRAGFHFDASACSGCKACAMACRDRHALPDGVRWRRVYEMAGGGWTRQGDAWVNDVVAYNVSISCNHCEHPACTEVCPTGAMHAGPDGVVLVDADRCMGCRYCEWACAYGAPQYDANTGRMSKCTFCIDDVARGLQPACVAACPLRVLDAGAAVQVRALHEGAPDMHPLPDPSFSRPALVVTPHAGASRTRQGVNAARVANREEVLAAGPLREPSLVAFTILTQMAAGLVWAVLLAGVASDAPFTANTLPWLAAGPLLAVAGLAATAHLGVRRNAWRAFHNVRTSWLSREAAAGALFLSLWALTLVLHAAAQPRAAAWAAVATALAGLLLVLAMAAVYRLRSVPAWNTRLTPASFLLSALSLGALTAVLLGAIQALLTQQPVPAGTPLLLLLAAASLVIDLALAPARAAVQRRAAAAVDPHLFSEHLLEAQRLTGARAPSTLRVAGLVTIAVLLLPDDGTAAVQVVTAGSAVALALAAAAAVQARRAFYASFARAGL